MSLLVSGSEAVVQPHSLVSHPVQHHQIFTSALYLQNMIQLSNSSMTAVLHADVFEPGVRRVA